MASSSPSAYRDTVCHLQQDEIFEKIITGQIQVPDVESSILNAFPPALIPLWTTGARTVIGLWIHWFSSSRHPTFVEYYGNTIYGKRNMVFEHGRTLNQILYGHLIDLIAMSEGITSEIRRFSSSIGIPESNLDDLDRRTVDGDGLFDHPEFAGNLPLSFFIDPEAVKEYKGDFPTIHTASNPAALRHCCVLEVHSGFKSSKPDYTAREMAAKNVNAPEWFKTSSQYELFQRLLDEKNLEGAWMCLNSPEWKIVDARKAILDLSKQGNNLTFNDLANTWIKLNFEQDETF